MTEFDWKALAGIGEAAAMLLYVYYYTTGKPFNFGYYLASSLTAYWLLYPLLPNDW